MKKKNVVQAIKKYFVKDDKNDSTDQIAFEAFQAEYEHCVQRAGKLDNKVYILLTVCAFLFVPLTSIINEAKNIKFPKDVTDLTLVILYAILVIFDIVVYCIMLSNLIGLLKGIKFFRFNTEEILEMNLIEQPSKVMVKYIGTKYAAFINYNNQIYESRYKKLNLCTYLLVANVIASILLEILCVFISLKGGMGI